LLINLVYIVDTCCM